MHKFPVTEDLAFLQGNEIASIALNQYSVDIKFAEGTLLRIELGLEYTDAEGRVQAHDPQRPLESRAIAFHALIGDIVARLETSDYRMTLDFVSGRKLVVLSDASQYEAGQIDCAAYDERGVLQSLGMIVF